jgi:L-ribulose-5-phosphate 4-epimerase
MRLAKLREQVLEANLDLVRRGLVLSTFGNASGVARKEGLIVIKPSGVPYHRMKPKDLVLADLQGEVVEGKLRPSSDLPTHAALYRAHAFGICDGVGAGSQTNSVPGHHARRLFSRRDSIDRSDDR